MLKFRLLQISFHLVNLINLEMNSSNYTNRNHLEKYLPGLTILRAKEPYQKIWQV